MDIKTPLPIFPTPPGTYSQQYMNDLISALNRFSAVVANPGEGRQSSLVLTGLSQSDYGLEPGGLFQVAGVVRVALMNSAYPPSLSATGRVGTVAVTT